MTKPPLRFMRNEYIEDVTAQHIRQHEAKTEVRVKFPVPAEEIIEQPKAHANPARLDNRADRQ